MTAAKQQPLKIGSATEVPGKIVRGSLEVADLPTGSKLNLPVMIASSGKPGPTFLLTANIVRDALARYNTVWPCA